METDTSTVAELEHRHRREIVSLSAIEWSYLRELGIQLDGGSTARVPARRAQAHPAGFHTAMQVEANERHAEAVAGVRTGADRHLGAVCLTIARPRPEPGRRRASSAR